MRKALLWVAMILIYPVSTSALNVQDYLIDSDIGQYSRSYPGACPKGSGIIAAAGHFRVDHIDYACDIRYYNETLNLGVFVQVTQHAGSDSDKWLLHEVDRDFRNHYGIPGRSYGPRIINGQTILEDLVGGGHYRWISGTKVISIEYHDAQMTNPEPIEVIQAYLGKHPSTLAGMTLTQLRSTENKTIWIKDEMDRRLWLCDKWFMQLQLKKAEEKDVYRESVKNMTVFLDYREKYYGVKAADEKNLLSGYLSANNGTGIKAKLTEYKNWWSVNKEKAIS